jgi:glycopeptide antibiotics resistance protein
MKIENHNVKMFLRVLFAVYILLLLGVVTLRFLNPAQLHQMKEAISSGYITPNTVPLKTIKSQLKNIRSGYARWNIMANTICFMPFGFLLPLITKRKCGFFRTFFSGVLLSLFIEVCQYVFSIGLFDVDDIILNVVGVIFGYVLALVIFAVIVVPLRHKRR